MVNRIVLNRARSHVKCGNGAERNVSKRDYTNRLKEQSGIKMTIDIDTENDIMVPFTKIVKPIYRIQRKERNAFFPNIRRMFFRLFGFPKFNRRYSGYRESTILEFLSPSITEPNSMIKLSDLE